MSEEAAQVEQYREQTGRVRRRATQIFVVVLLICAAVVLPPFINIGRYQREITALMTRSLGRPVRLASVKLRLLPRPGFVLSNLSVGEAPEFGVEPILSAQTVVASIRLSALLTGKVEVDRISLDDASLNLVQASPGRWNIDQIMMGGLVQGMTQTAPTAAQPVFRRQPAAFPYLEAKNSRVNLKRGLEKLPYSLVNTQLSFWQDSPGIWRLRLRGQPARTDMEMSFGDTGDLRLEGTLQTLPGHGLYQMPIKVQAAWREAQLGQLSRLLLGSDQGWRGDLTADLNIQGTADAAQTDLHLRATSVRREEFVPLSPMDFDIHCGLLYQHTRHAVRNMDCNTGMGGGKLQVKADLPGDNGEPEAALTVDGLPLQAGLDMLRTVRSGFAPGLSAEGKVSGALHLGLVAPAAVKPGSRSATAQAAKKSAQQPQEALAGDLTITGGALRGGGLPHPLALPKVVLTAAQMPGDGPAGTPTLATRFPLSLAAPPDGKTQAAAHSQELTVRLQLSPAGYQVGISGSAPPERLRELAYALGGSHSQALDNLAGGQADVDSTAAGPWLATAEPNAAASPAPAAAVAKPEGGHGAASAAAKAAPGRGAAGRDASGRSLVAGTPLPLPGASDQLTGVVHLHHVAWAASYLAHAVAFPEATVSLAGKVSSASGSFTYGALAGTASVTGIGCGNAVCPPQVEIHLADTDAATIEAALLGAPEKKSLLSPLIDRIRSTQRTPWPEAAVKVTAENLTLGPVTLHKPLLQIKLTARDLTLESWQASMLGGEAKGTGSSTWNGNQLAYTLEGSFNNLSGAQLGLLLDHAAAASAEQENGNAGQAARPDQAARQDQGKPDQGKQEPPASEDTQAGAASAGMWTGGPIDGSGKVELSGLTAKELAASANGTLHFHWIKGTVPVMAATAGTASGAEVSAGAARVAASAHLLPARFLAWTGDAMIRGGSIVLGSNTLTGLPHEQNAEPLAGSIPLGGPAHLTRAARPAEPQVASGKAARKP